MFRYMVATIAKFTYIRSIQVAFPASNFFPELDRPYKGWLEIIRHVLTRLYRETHVIDGKAHLAGETLGETWKTN